MNFDQKKRDLQLEFLDKMDGKESLGVSSCYVIYIKNKAVDSCQCAGTAMMLLNTKYQNINVFIKKC